MELTNRNSEVISEKKSSTMVPRLIESQTSFNRLQSWMSNLQLQKEIFFFMANLEQERQQLQLTLSKNNHFLTWKLYLLRIWLDRLNLKKSETSTKFSKMPIKLQTPVLLLTVLKDWSITRLLVADFQTIFFRHYCFWLRSLLQKKKINYW